MINKITDGLNGQQVADLLYDNDKELETGVNSLTSVVGEPDTLVLPTPTWLAQGWLYPAQAGFVWVDVRAKVDRDNVIKKFNCVCSTAGTLRIGFYDAASFVRTSYQDVTMVVGANSFDIAFSNASPHYVAIEGLTGEVSLIDPPTGNTYGGQITGGAFVVNNYPFAYTIEVDSVTNTLAGRVTNLEAIVGAGTSADINEALANSDVVTLEPIDYYLDAPVVITSGKTLRGSFGRTRIFMNGQTNGITATANDIKLADFELIGGKVNYSYAMNGMIAGSGYTLISTIDQALAFTYMGSETGISLVNCERVAMHNVKIRNIDGFAMYVSGVGKQYIWGAKFSDCFISDCYGGIRTENEHEYCQYANFSITLCQIAVSCASGNLMFNNISCTRGMIGMLYKTGYNHAHGIASIIEAKHNQIAGIVCDSIQFGQFFNGAYLSYCNLVIRNSRGCFFSPVMFEGGAEVICTGNYPDGSNTGKNVIKSAMCTHGALVVSGGGNIVVQDVYNAITSI